LSDKPELKSRLILWGTWGLLLTCLPLAIFGFGDARFWLVVNLAVSLVTMIIESRNGVRIEETND